MLDNEPLRVLSQPEIERLRQSSVPIVAEEEVLELGRRIWQLALNGNNRDEISRKLKISLEVLDDTLNAYRMRLAMSIDHYRMLDNARIDELMAFWMPMATEPVLVQKIRMKKPVPIKDYDRSLKAAYFIVQAMQNRLRVLGATGALEGSGGAPGDGKPYTERNIIIWLREVMPSIDKITRELEVELTPVKTGDAE